MFYQNYQAEGGRYSHLQCIQNRQTLIMTFIIQLNNNSLLNWIICIQVHLLTTRIVYF